VIRSVIAGVGTAMAKAIETTTGEVKLKSFSLDGEGLAINLYKIDRRFGIRNGAVKGQTRVTTFMAKTQGAPSDPRRPA
jgi:hypothetical protein